MPDPFSTRTREQIAADNRAEIEAWIDERAAELTAGGMDPGDARRRAIDEFGDIGEAHCYAVSQDAASDRRIRAAFWLEEFVADIRIVVRSLPRAPIVSAVVLLTFALGIGAATAVFSVVHAMLLRPLPYGNEESLVQLQPVEDGVIRPAARYSAAALAALRAGTTTFTSIAGVEGGNAVIAENGEPEQVMISGLTPDGFDVLQARAAIGRTPGLHEQAGARSRVVVLLDGLWRRRFGADPDVVGRIVDVGGERREVIGVMPAAFRVPAYEAAELVTPRDLSTLLLNPNNSQVRFLRLFARLKPGVSREAAQADVDRVMRDLQVAHPRSMRGIDSRVVPIRTALAGDARPRLLVLMAAAAFVLLIACANVTGILLSRAIARRHELSVRVALGAGRRRLMRQFLAEGAVLAIVGASLGLLVAERGIAALQQMAAAALPPGTVFALELRVVLFALAAAVSAAFVSSVIPAVAATRTTASAPGREAGRATVSRANRRLRLGLVAAQLAVSVVLLIGAGLLLRTFHRLSVLDLGYTTGHAVTFRLPFTRPRSNQEQDVFWASLYERLRAIPGVVTVGGGNVPTSGQSTMTGLEIEGRPIEKSRLPDVRYSPASDDYFSALGIPIIRGRAFTSTDRDGAPAVSIVSASLAAQFWPGRDPLGSRIRVGPDAPWATIVGVAGDVRMGGADPARPSVYTSQRQDHWPGGGAVVVRAEGNAAGLAADIRQTVRSVDATLPIVGLRTLEEFRANTSAIAERRLQTKLTLLFALVALAVSAIGVFGVSAYATEARRHEFGIRMALGARRRSVLWLALRDGVQVTVLGALVGVPIALLMASALRDMLFAVTPFDTPTILAVLGLLAVVACAASVVPARRATLVDPASTMKVD
jgi:putative ABC transport system permease protein